jgi:hypothetical protein
LYTVFKKSLIEVFFILFTLQLNIFSSEIDRAFKQFVFECMDLAGTDPNGFLLTRDSEGLEHSAIPWDDPYPFFKGMIPKHEKTSKDELMSTPSDERSGKVEGANQMFICKVKGQEKSFLNTN